MTIDFHCHLGLSVDNAEGKVDDLLSSMDTCGIDKAVIFAINEKAVGRTYSNQNDFIMKTAKNDPDRFIPFCRIQPKAGNKAEEELLRCAQKGHKGLKLHPESDAFEPSDCHNIFTLAERLSLPILLHTSHGFGKTPSDWKSVLADHDQTPVILAHSGKDFYRLAGAMAQEMPHIYLDTSTLSYNRTRVLLDKPGPDKILFASDYPYSHPELEKKKFELLISDPESLNRIMGLNAKNILNIR